MPFPYVSQVWADADASKPLSAARMGVLEAGIALAGVVGTSSSPPGSPVDGMIWRYPANAGAGIYWFFQYDSSQATNKWVFMGGPPLSHEITTSEATASTTYVDLATVGPTLTLARAGDYEVEFGIAGSNGTATDGVAAAVKIGAAAAADVNNIAFLSPAINQFWNASRKYVKAAAAADVFKVQYRAVTGGTATFSNRYLFIRPIRVI